MDPCPFVRLLVGNLALKIPVASRPARSGVHPSSSPCYCKIRINKSPCQTAAVTLVPAGAAGAEQNPQTPTIAASFHLSQSDLDKAVSNSVISAGQSRLKLAIYTGRRGSTCGVNSGKLLGEVTLQLDLKGSEGKACVFHNGWVSLGNDSKRPTAMMHMTVRSEPEPRFVFEFDGEPECSPQVFQVQGTRRQPVFTCKFSTVRPGDRYLRTSSLPSESTTSRSWLSAFGSERERPGKERKGWYVTVHDLSGSTVAMASMATPFVACHGADRVSSSNPGAWIVFRLGEGAFLKPWGRLVAWRERGVSQDGLGYRFELMPDASDINGVGVTLAESTINTRKGGKMTLDLTRHLSPGCSPRGSGDFGYCLWPFSSYRGFVMSSTVEGEGKCSRPVVEIGAQHVGCTEDAAAFVALAAAIDLSMDACRLFSHKLRKELQQQQTS